MFRDYTMDATLQRRHNRQRPDGLAPINLRITIESARADLATGIWCPPGYWQPQLRKLVLPLDKKQQVLPEFSARALEQLNDELAAFKRDVNDIYRSLRKPDPRKPAVAVTIKQVRQAFRGYVTPAPPPLPAPNRQLLHLAGLLLVQLQAAPDDSRLESSTLKTYVSRRNTLERYLLHLATPTLLAADVDQPWCRRFEHWLISPEGNHGPTAMRKQIGFLQQALDLAVIEGWLTEKRLHGYKYQTRAPKRLPVSLPLAEVGRLEAALPEFDLPTRRVVTGWLFCAHTGLSWVDYRRFCEQPAAFLHMDAGQCWLRMVRQKMKRRKPQGFSVPLFDPAADLLVAWRGRLPHTNDVNTNKILHRVEHELGLSESLTTKLARATFSQLRRDEGYNDETVAAMMGDTVSVMNQHYSRISERRISLEMGQIQSRQQMHIAA